VSRWRIAVVLVLICFPVLFLAGVGSYFLWTSGLSLVLWWPLMAAVAVGYLLAGYWLRRRTLLHPVDFIPPEVSTERDWQAWQVVEKHARADGISNDQLTSADYYLHTAQGLARELAAHYQPNEDDPLGGRTLPELLAVIELAARDLGEMVDRYLPGGHLLTLRDFKRARQAVDWYKSATQAYWVVSALLTPFQTAARYLASQVGVSRPLQAVQENLLAWFHRAFVQQVGFYLIELYSGRLRVGAQRWRELVRGEREEPRTVSLVLLGQVKAGKSSLVNALLGERKAQTDVLPSTDALLRYHLAPPGIPAHLLLTDSPGYGHEGPKADALEKTCLAAQQADGLLLVLHARNPARQADVSLLQGLRKWFADRPDLKEPPVIAVLTHIDLLSPAMEWQPPYDWQKGERPKERNIRAAVEATREQLGGLVDAVVPVCTAEGKVTRIDEGLLPALAASMDESRVVAVLRCLRNEPDTGKLKRVFGQLLEAGKGLFHALRSSSR
jgi:predicted GTPase